MKQPGEWEIQIEIEIETEIQTKSEIKGAGLGCRPGDHTSLAQS